MIYYCVVKNKLVDAKNYIETLILEEISGHELVADAILTNQDHIGRQLWECSRNCGSYLR